MTPEVNIMQTVKKLHISDPTKEKEIYEKILNKYYERYIRMVFNILEEKDQSILADLIDNQAANEKIESFIESKLPDIAQMAESSLNNFLLEYEDRMGLIHK